MIPIVIPVYRPERTFVEFIKNLTSELTDKKENFKIVIVNDGNSTEMNCFEEIKNDNVFIVSHAVNLGKGRALKTGFNFVLCNWKNAEGVVTCDADGQHTIHDILSVKEELHNNPNKLILGCRTFEDDIPFRSKFGNKFTSFVFNILTGIRITDTQTGLREIPREYMKRCLSLDGERYEFEMNMLLETTKSKIHILQIPIETIYIDANESSHFNPFIDSLKIYRLIVKFLFSSLFSAFADFIIFTIVFFLSKNLALSLILARIVSLLLNFKVNKDFVFVFESHKKNLVAFIKYCVLAMINLCLSYFGISFLHEILKIPVYILKIIVECTLFFVNYGIQRDFIFR